jgi:hypothetical protein
MFNSSLGFFHQAYRTNFPGHLFPALCFWRYWGLNSGLYQLTHAPNSFSYPFKSGFWVQMTSAKGLLNHSGGSVMQKQSKFQLWHCHFGDEFGSAFYLKLLCRVSLRIKYVSKLDDTQNSIIMTCLVNKKYQKCPWKPCKWSYCPPVDKGTHSTKPLQKTESTLSCEQVLGSTLYMEIFRAHLDQNYIEINILVWCRSTLTQ